MAGVRKIALYTVGQGGKSWDELAGILIEAGVKLVMDIRDSPYSWNPDFRKDSLRLKFAKTSIAYSYVGHYLGNPPVLGKRTRPSFIKQGILNRGFAREKLPIIRQHVWEKPTALFCGCGKHRFCHRADVAEWIIGSAVADIVHL